MNPEDIQIGDVKRGPDSPMDIPLTPPMENPNTVSHIVTQRALVE